MRLMITVAVPVIVAAAGCGIEGSPSGSGRPPAPSTTEAPPQLWAEVTDGTWDFGDFALGQPNKMRLSDYAITVTGPPTLTTADGGKTVRMTSPLHVERMQEQGVYNYAGVPVSESEYFGFVPGNRSIDTHDEVYGDDVTVHCDREPAQVGDSAQCSLSFDAPADEIQNSYWTINRASMAAWPGQL